nr:hypothetical protein BaRGS_007823 [Batillaria attramentaria]
MVMIGLIINAVLACFVFVFAYTHKDSDGKVKIKKPDTAFEDKYDDERYFQVDKAGQGRDDNWELRECVRLDLVNGSLTMIGDDVCQSQAFITNLTYVYITFSFVKPDPVFKRRIFGDIRYNIKVGSGGKCLDYDNITDDVNQADNRPIIHYYRTKASLSTTTSHLVQDDGGPRFFRNGHDMTDVDTVWKTGWGQCKSSGCGGPTLQRNIRTGCD